MGVNICCIMDYIYITPCHLKRLKDDENEIVCKGYWFEVFTDDKMLFPLDVFGGAVGFELLNDTENERVQYARDVIDAEEKQYQKLAYEIIASG